MAHLLLISLWFSLTVNLRAMLKRCGWDLWRNGRDKVRAFCTFVCRGFFYWRYWSLWRHNLGRIGRQKRRGNFSYHEGAPAAVNVLKRFGIKPLNAIGNNYRPHLTLARITMPKQMEVWSKNLFENSGNFQLEFGLSDEHWQYARTLSVFPPLKSGIYPE